MATGRMNQLIILVNLCSSVVEGVEHLMAYQENVRLKEDAVTGLLTLEEELKGLKADRLVIHDTKQMAKLIQYRLFVYDRKFKDRLYNWYFNTLKELKNLMTEEMERCPICSGNGSPFYGALYYQEREGDKDILEPVRTYLKCKECGNYYLVKEERRITKKQHKNKRTKSKCNRILSDIGKFVTEKSMLFIGEEKSQLYLEAAISGYHLDRISIEDRTVGVDPNKKKYPIVLIDRISCTRDWKQILKLAADYVTEDGIVWFDGPDLEKFMEHLKKRGTPVWNREADEVCLTEDGMELMAEQCGLTIKSYRQVGTTQGRIEVIAKNSLKEGEKNGSSDNT
ncbi:hypothetical protein [Clostridium sp. E02]|uniref:hypothetical protein n=1 Tax=Clostridium sp. E02 TaxID=2487134 RepID=UPI000F526607|nr:hypothetical protein [Clostridium sp. E02]